jgi:P-type Ca2+ transporter type 2C
VPSAQMDAMPAILNGSLESFEPHQLSAEELPQRLQVKPAQGLLTEEARRRLAEQGPNELTERSARTPWAILWDQLSATMVLVLLAAAAISFALRDAKDAIAILAIVVLNAALGFVQEYRAEKAMAALKKLAVPSVTVRRDGQVQFVPARDLVRGDVLYLEAGNLVAADCRLLDAESLRVDEAALTGESMPVEKVAGVCLEGSVPLAERRNMVYLGTAVREGHAIAVVTHTGMRTELGRIAGLLQRVKREPTPLQRRLDRFGRSMAVASLGLIGIIVVFGLLHGEEIRLMFLTAVSMAVAVVPEGLPAVVTIALALGARRMLKRQALIRRLPAVESLGSVTVICTDKTGTLTENRMAVTALMTGGHEIAFASAAPAISSQPECALLMLGAALCNNARLEPEKGGQLRAIGDPTESALVLAAAQAGLLEPALKFPRVAEWAFDSGRKRMTTVHRLPANESSLSGMIGTVWPLLSLDKRFAAFSKGAFEGLLAVCDRWLQNERTVPLTDGARRDLTAASERLAGCGHRVLGVAYRGLDVLPEHEQLERGLVFVGMIGLADPPRADAKTAVSRCQAAGVRPVMITGDHPMTARHIAQAVGIEGRLLSGPDLDRMPAGELEARANEVSVYARVVPEQKLKIVQALQSRGHLVAMTGDGVNDAPALKKADIGVAMGLTGTDVAKEAADLVLLDDDFSTLVAAVEEGRAIYDNIRKFIRYVLAGNVGEIFVMLFGPLLGMPLPLLPLQILWINLVTDGASGLALSVEPPERDAMRRPPYPPAEGILDRRIATHIAWVGTLMGLIPLCVGWYYWQHHDRDWQSMVFSLLAFGQIFQTLAAHSWTDSAFASGRRPTLVLILSVSLTMASTLAILYVPILQRVFGTRALSSVDLAVTLILSTVVFWSMELEKFFKRRHR